VDFVIALTVEGYEFALYEGLIDIAGFKLGLVERLMKIKLEEMLETLKQEFV
jgi:ribosomal protein S10